LGGIKTLNQWLNWQENLHDKAIDLGLERIQKVYSKLFPNGVAFTTIIVAGTNGKGSTIAFLDAIYRQSSVTVATFTSPHILHYNERFTMNGLQATDAQICTAFEQIERARGEVSLTYFEFSTLAALLMFSEQKIDLAILEIGLGGRLDSVNVVEGDVSLITNIALDHIDYLGDTRELIGREKAGIMRTGKPCICADTSPPLSLEKHAKNIGAKLEFVKKPYEGELSLKGDYQRQNAALAILCVQQLNLKFPLNAEQIKRGLKTATLAGRFQIKHLKGKQFIFDVAHNEAATQVLAQELAKQKCPTLAIFSALKDKNIKQMIEAIAPVIDAWLVAPLQVNRAANSEFLVAQFKHEEKVQICADTAAAIEQALAQKTYARIVIFGSFHLVADALKIL
jgi:dihydrofolate synthase/folylpolyglutamate synthase